TYAVYIFRKGSYSASILPNNPNKFSGLRFQINIGNNLFSLYTKGYILHTDMHYDSPPNEYVLFLSNQIKNGPPDKAVTTPIGISSGTSASLATTSAQIINKAPKTN